MNKFIFGVITIFVALPVFLFARTIWPFPVPVAGATDLFFSFATGIESIFLGIGVAFVVAVFTWYRRVVGMWRFLDWATFVSVAWILLSGYPHDNMHIARGSDLHGLILIEIFFHRTLAIAALVITYFFLRNLALKLSQLQNSEND